MKEIKDMEIYVRLSEDLRKEVMKKVIERSKEESEAIGIEAVILEREIDDLLEVGYPVSYILRNCLNDVKDLCRLIPEDEVIMKIK